MWIVLTHNTMCGMKLVLRVFRQNTNPRPAERFCAEIAKGTWQPNWWATGGQPLLLVAQNLVLLELLETPHLLTSLLAPQGFESGSVQLTL